MATQQKLALFEPIEKPTLLELATANWMAARVAKRTWDNDLYCLRKWEALFPRLQAAQITVEHCRQFYRWLQVEVKKERLTADTANKIARGVNVFLKLIAPDDGSIDPADPDLILVPFPLLDRPLRVKLPQCEQIEDVERAIEWDEFGAFLAAAAHAKWNGVHNRRLWPHRPPCLAAARWWHETAIFLYNTALRIEEGLAVLPSDLHKDAYGRYLRVRREVAKTGRPRKVYLNQWAASSADVLCAQGGKTILDWQLSQNRLDKERRRIFERANLDRLLEEGIGFGGLRKLCATELETLAGEATAGKHLGHVPKTVTGKNYGKRRGLIGHLSRLPQPVLQELPAPAEFAHDPQLALFDYL